MPTDWVTEIEAWARWLRAAGRPGSTITMRTYHVRRVGREVGSDPWTVTVDELATWLASHQWAAETRRGYRASLRAFYSWAQATGRRQDSPAHLLPPVKVPRGRPRPVPEPAYRAALLIAPEREMLAIRLAAQCGLRRGEVARARREDAEQDLTGYSIRVRGKGGHTRVVPMPDPLAHDILARPEGWLFPSSDGRHITPHHLAKRVSACLPEGYTMHKLRHRAASVAYGATKDLRAVQEMLGHASPDTTTTYTLVPDDDVRAAVDAAAA